MDTGSSMPRRTVSEWFGDAWTRLWLWRDGLLRSVEVARCSLAEEKTQRAAPSLRREEIEFLPAALEVIESPPSPAGRVLAGTLMALAVIVVAWASIGEIDVVAVAQGRVVPSGRSKVIQPLESGVVRELLVRNGEQVRSGQVVLRLDTTLTAADRERLRNDLLAARLETARLKAALSKEGEAAFVAPAGADARTVGTQRALLASALGEHRARLSALAEEITKRGAERAASAAGVQKLERTVPIARERAVARRELAEKGYLSRMAALEFEQQLIEQEHDLAIQRHRVEEAAAAIGALERQRTQAESGFRKQALLQLAEAERRTTGLAQELVKAEQRHALQSLASPIDGTVQELAVHTLGGVVTAAQAVMVVVPHDDTLEVEAQILNKDVGFIRPGQEAEVKFETFLFTRYGTIRGRVESVSSDAVTDAKLGLVYPVRVALPRTTLDGGEAGLAIAPGMSATVEIKTDTRKVIDYVLSPLMRYRKESFRER